jgi:DNA-binding MarR family transcriptional regulator
VADVDERTPLLLLLTHATRHVVDGLQSHLVAAGFEDHRVVHHNVMAHVTFDGIRLSDLAERAGITKQAMSELVADLERRGYLTRAPDPHDGRAKLIRFTDRGADAVQAAGEAFAHMDAALAERLGDAAVADLRTGLVGVLHTPLGAPATQ